MMPIKKEGNRMSKLQVPGAELYYEVRGDGPLLILIPGSNGRGEIFGQVAGPLAERYRVVTYDRRGFSRSELVGPQDNTQRLAIEAEDARRLIEALTDKPATIFGTDSGAVIALEFLNQYPEQVQKVVSHEPLAVNLLPDAPKWQAFFEEVYQTYRQSGVPKAIHQFASGIGSADHRLMMPYIKEEKGERIWANASYWMEHELRQYSRLKLDPDLFTANTKKLVLAGGRDSRDQLTYQANKILAQKLGLSPVDLPGGHLGYLAYPAEFAKALIDALKTERKSYEGLP